MISIIPCKEILKSVCDNNVSKSQPSKIKVTSFHKATYLSVILKNDIEVVLEGITYNNLKSKMNESHKIKFENLYDIDYSGIDLTEFDKIKATKFIVKEKKLKLSKKNKCILITENSNDYSEFNSEKRVVIISPKDFIEKCNRFEEIKDSFSNQLDALIFLFFFNGG